MSLGGNPFEIGFPAVPAQHDHPFDQMQPVGPSSELLWHGLSQPSANQLIDLGMFEQLPPFHIIDDLYEAWPLPAWLASTEKS